jgi:hypothetical protein
MSFTRCPFCEHGNPADAKFCSECGGALHLAPCAHCGAVNQVTASACYQCHRPLPGRGAAAPAPSPPAELILESSPVAVVSDALPVVVSDSLPVAAVAGSLPRRRSRTVVATVVVMVVAIAALGYNAYRQRWMTNDPPPQAAGSEAGRNAAVGAPGSPSATGGGSASAAIVPAATSLAVPAHAAVEQSRAGRQPPEPQKARGAAMAVERPEPASTGAAGRVSREACTEAAAALGLCVMGPARKKAPEAAAALDAASGPASKPGNSGGQEPSRQQPCTEAVAALGLCAPNNVQGR